MGLHQRHTHGHVFRDAAAREQLAMRKRETNGDQPVMHVPEDIVKRQSDNEDDGVQVVYVTLPQTFTGSARYLTLSTMPSVLKAPPIQAQATSTRSATRSATSVSSAVVTPARERPSSATASASATESDSYSPTTLATSSRVAGTPLRAGETSTSTATPEATSAGGMTSGGKAGLAFGIIFLIGALAGAVYFFLWRKRKQNAARNGEVLNEKHSSFPRSGSYSKNGIPAAAATGAFAAPAMRSMEQSRSMDQGERMASKRDSVQTEKVPASVRSARTTSTAPRLSLRPITQLMPFGGDRTSTGATMEGERRDNPFNDGNPASENARSNSPPSDPFNGANSGTVANASQTSLASQSSNSAVPMAAGGAPPRGPNNVHRVQLDFKPSMDDELELRSGQLVRMLHEYDDGWALCIRMDRSQQGVAPRTCLSKLPVKPRPQGPPSQQGSRPGTANSQRGPPNGAGMMVPRPLTPSSADRDISPPMRSELRPSPESTVAPTGAMPARKPVPGQAL